MADGRPGGRWHYISNDAFSFSDTFFDLFQEKYKKSKKSGLTEVMSQTYISQTHGAAGVKYKYEISPVNVMTGGGTIMEVSDCKKGYER